MKKLYITLLIALMAITLSAQCFYVTVSAEIPTFPGRHDGSLTATPHGGTPPYKYVWYGDNLAFDSIVKTADTAMVGNITYKDGSRRLKGIKAGNFHLHAYDAAGAFVELDLTLRNINTGPDIAAFDREYIHHYSMIDTATEQWSVETNVYLFFTAEMDSGQITPYVRDVWLTDLHGEIVGEPNHQDYHWQWNHTAVSHTLNVHADPFSDHIIHYRMQVWGEDFKWEEQLNGLPRTEPVIDTVTVYDTLDVIKFTEVADIADFTDPVTGATFWVKNFGEYLQSSEQFEGCKVYSLTGSLVKQVNLSTEVPVSDLEKGIYLFHFKFSLGEIRQRFYIE